MTIKALMLAFLGCLVAVGAQAQSKSVPEAITGYRNMSVSFSEGAADCNLKDANVFKTHLSEKLAGIGISETGESYSGVNLRISGRKFGAVTPHCVTSVEFVFQAAIGKDNFVTSDERLKATIDEIGVIPIVFYRDGRMAVQPQSEPSAGGESETSKNAALKMIDEMVASLKAKR